MNSITKTAQLANLVGALTGAPIPMSGPLDWISEILNPEAITRNLVFLTALGQNFNTRYNPNAFYHVLEMDKSRGYEAIDPNTGAVLTDPMTGKKMLDKDDNPYVFQHSQGHLERLDYKKLQNELNRIPTTGPHGATTDRQFSELKPDSDMPLFVKKNININENSPEYKAMFDKLYPGVTRPAPTASSNKFVRVAQTSSQKSTNDQKSQEVKKLMPKWDIKTVINELDTISQSGQEKGLTEEQISFQIQNRLKQYQDSVKPLHDYLVKNGYGQKTP
jgi:hypothetical protein